MESYAISIKIKRGNITGKRILRIIGLEFKSRRGNMKTFIRINNQHGKSHLAQGNSGYSSTFRKDAQDISLFHFHETERWPYTYAVAHVCTNAMASRAGGSYLRHYAFQNRIYSKPSACLSVVFFSFWFMQLSPSILSNQQQLFSLLFFLRRAVRFSPIQRVSLH